MLRDQRGPGNARGSVKIRVETRIGEALVAGQPLDHGGLKVAAQLVDSVVAVCRETRLYWRSIRIATASFQPARSQLRPHR